MGVIKLNKITQSQISAKGVQALADRPNASAQYGVGGLSSTQLKLWFDKLASFLADKINELQNTLADESAAQYIRVVLDSVGVTTLQDLVDSFASGKFAEDLLMLKSSASATVRDNIQSIVFSIAQDISALYEKAATLREESGARTELTFSASTSNLVFTLYNTENEVLSSHTINLKVTTERIVDAAVTTPKINDRAVTASKIAVGNVNTEHISNNAVTEGKILDGNVTTPKIKERAVTTSKIALGGITEAELASGSVTTGKIKDAAVTGGKIAAGSITNEKLSSVVQNRILSLEGNAFVDIVYDTDTGVLTFTSTNGSSKSVDLPLELIVSDRSYFDDTEGAEAAVLVLANGSEIRIPIDSMTSRLVNYMNGIREKMFDLQEAPPLASLSAALTLTTPTLAQLAALN